MSNSSSLSSRQTDKNRTTLAAELQFLGQMLSTETALFHQTAAAKNDLTITDSKTVSTLIQEGPMTAGELAKRLSLTTGAVTSVIDRLEKAGFAKRTADPDDRRKVIVKVDTRKLQELGKVYDSMGTSFQALLSGYSLEQLQFLAAFYRASIELTKEEIAKLAKG